MDNSIFQWFNQFFSKEWAVFFTAGLPIVELRGAIPLAISLGIEPGKAYWLAVFGNVVPVIPLLLLLQPVRDLLIRYSALMERFFNWLDQRTLRKSKQINKYGALGLIYLRRFPCLQLGPGPLHWLLSCLKSASVTPFRLLWPESSWPGWLY